MDIILGSVILMGLTELVVRPLANYWLKTKLGEPAFAYLNGPDLTEEHQSTLNRLGTKYFIFADLLVLGTAGFIGGLLGFCFIGLSCEAKGWPGMIALIAASFFGLSFQSNFTLVFLLKFEGENLQ